ncbi:HET-domain-containing protein [Hyaloscypha variabilis F]|uniref:HET-domain-containing protein n=1 Tax=Hyaloscypha variabilis (strain UAMH 11265 / GT02V1 / F) TaxID=1149755 RepID=A0A2J6S271_HYAVF|nr:HET-domain-containing protein [Hyaloscypha variabilis F]
MRLLHTQTLTLYEFPPNAIPPYAILSHTWGEGDEEVKLQDLGARGVERKAGYAKIKGCCRQAQEDGLAYAWVDTCCIDKTSSAELSEAINSMFRWYANAKVCYTYLVDVPSSGVDQNGLVNFMSSRWFTRGWTLQELIAPANVVFYTREWTKLGTKRELTGPISAATGIHEDILLGRNLMEVSIANRMSWASRRVTTRPEDIAYCLLGIFGINMPLLYGEDQKAFIRLQEEIIKVSDDHSIFAWKSVPLTSDDFRGLLALSPHMFKDIGSILPYRDGGHSKPFAMSNKGLQIELPLLRVESIGGGDYLGILNCRSADEESPLAIELRSIPGDEGRYARSRPRILATPPLWKVTKAVRTAIRVDNRKPPGRFLAPGKVPPWSIVFRTLPAEETLRLVDFYPHDSWNKKHRTFVFPPLFDSAFVPNRFGLLFEALSGARFAVLGGRYYSNGADKWVNILQDPYDFTKIIREHERTITNRATMIWKDGESRVEMVAQLEDMVVGYDMMTVVDVKISH